MSLLDAQFVKELEVLKRRLDTQARSGQSGPKPTTRLGSATEFTQHRQYSPGDDLRRIDWLAFARSGKPMLKQYSSEEDAVGRILFDQSASLGFGAPSKLTAAKRVAGAIAYLWLCSGLRCQIIGSADRVSGGDRAGPGRTKSQTHFYPTRRGRSALARALGELESISAGGRTELGRWVGAVVARSSRPGILVVISDFLDPNLPLDALDRARSKGNEVVLLQVLAPQELSPDLDGDLSLTDVESGETLSVSIDGATLDAYQQQLTDLSTSLERWATQRQQTYLRFSSADALAPVLQALVLSRHARRG